MISLYPGNAGSQFTYATDPVEIWGHKKTRCNLHWAGGSPARLQWPGAE